MAKRSYRKKSFRKGSKKVTRRTYRKKGSRKGSKKSRKSVSKKRSKRCPKGEVRTMRRLASGKLGKGKCMPKTMVSKEEAIVPDYEFDLPALGFRIKKGRKASKKSKRSYRKKGSRKGSKKSRKGSKKSRKGSKKSRKGSKKSRGKKYSKRR